MSTSLELRTRYGAAVQGVTATGTAVAIPAAHYQYLSAATEETQHPQNKVMTRNWQHSHQIFSHSYS